VLRPVFGPGQFVKHSFVVAVSITQVALAPQSVMVVQTFVQYPPGHVVDGVKHAGIVPNVQLVGAVHGDPIMLLVPPVHVPPEQV
jgi:hypothetical protein